MALQTAATHKATADSRTTHEYDNSIMNDIETAVDAAVNETPPRCDIHCEYTINGSGVKQPDTTFVELDATIAALRAAGYTTAYWIKNHILHLHLRLE